MFFTTCRTCGDTLHATFLGQETHPTCEPTASEQLARQFVDAVQRHDSVEADRLESLLNKSDEPPSLGSAALWYAEVAGWPVFPLRPGSKVPATRDGFKSATTDAQQIREWWNRAEYNIGLPTGTFFEVLDVDGPDGYKSLASIQEHVPDVHGKVLTPRGEHLLILPEGNGNRAGVLPGLDVRGIGGYVVCPPSVVDGKRYTWALRPSPEILGLANAV